MKLKIVSRSGNQVCELDVASADETVSELKKQLHQVKKKLYPSRQRLTLPLKAGETRATVLENGAKLSDYGLGDGSMLQLKDLGPQVGYATVFFWEYFGPLIVYPLFFFFPKLFYPGMRSEAAGGHHLAQKLALYYWSFHYIKRILETFYVHKFGHDTMPVANLFRNSAYYWGFAAFVSYFINHPLYHPPRVEQTLVALGLAMVCQLSNFRCHLILSNLRKPGEKGYKIPRGFLFEYITCANYTVEVFGWLLFTTAVQALPAAIFSTVGTLQMAQWALQKHKRLRKMFDGKEGRPKYPRRWIMIPPLF
uniref:Ubiquitin-like domain-containing protein n=2 Tax=Dunaliella tertiolecta TaxID=3047 RepID=A0A7S3QRB7_DUNTE|mmetsp:Transcript_21474/g.59471  ORF Transcript_21474/g.59471 Transcript_21474/m.59471 type:complete len:308 (-) Transcript_21474:1176-2099(-)